jgi:transcriptional regulator with XRE-family HTH domain
MTWTAIIMIVHTHEMAADKRNPLGPTGETVRANMKRLMELQNLGYAQLSRKLAEVGRSIPDLGLRRVEAGDRRIDVDDLMALAAAFDVSPVTLLMPEVPPEEWETDVQATGQPEPVTAQRLWLWLTAAGPPIRPTYNAENLKWVAGAVPRAVFNSIMARYPQAEADLGND